MYKCDECGKESALVWYLSEYGRRAADTKDDGEYCNECFDKKFEEQHDKD